MISGGAMTKLGESEEFQALNDRSRDALLQDVFKALVMRVTSG